jgi:hypothetical protein
MRTAVTDEFHPGFRNSVASYTVSLLNPHVIADIGPHSQGLRIVERSISNFLPIIPSYQGTAQPPAASTCWRSAAAPPR